MKLLNLACGNTRPQTEEWTNLDELYNVLHPGTPERANLDSERNYVNCNLMSDKLPFEETFDGILASHCIEHWTCGSAVKVMRQCWDVLKPGGILLVSVPDASYFRKVYDRDTVENAQELFGEPIHLPDGETTFFGYGLWNKYHRAILTEDALWCYFVRAGFKHPKNMRILEGKLMGSDVELNEAYLAMKPFLNRLEFSLVLASVKE